MDDEFELVRRYHPIQHSEVHSNGNWPTDSQIQSKYLSFQKVPSAEGKLIYR